ncbi:MAG: hypothetical protein U0930_05045 [Pirellulales bacterium]
MLKVTDQEIRDRLVELDNSDKTVDSWTATFIDSIVFRFKGPLSEKQRSKALEILERFGF